MFSVTLLAMVVLALGLPQASFAQANNCMANEYFANGGSGNKMNCTANDVRIAYADNVRNLDGTSRTTCQLGETFSFVADFHVVTTATARENIGLYFQTQGGANAETGTCSDNIIAPPHRSSNSADVVTLGTSQYEELDANEPNVVTTPASPNTGCGDISTSDNNQVVTVEVVGAKCEPEAGSNPPILRLPNCTSWQQPGGTIQCISPGPSYPWQPAAIPGTTSKCNCDNAFTVPIQVQSPTISVTKTCNTSASTGTGLTSCTLSPEGGTATYHVTVNNTSNFGSITLDQICDSAYGNLGTVSGFTPGCQLGTTGTSASNGCSVPQIIAAGSSYSCDFTATQPESTTVRNTVTANGLGQDGTTRVTGASTPQVVVTAGEAPTTGTISKTYSSTPNVCATVRYNVDVKNTSAADETLTLSSFSDVNGFGDITTVHGSAGVTGTVLGTTCGQSSPNTNGGTLSTSPGAGVLPVTLGVTGSGNNDYACQFDGVFCGALGSVVLTHGTCAGGICTVGNTARSSCTTSSDCDLTCTGITNTDTLSAGLKGDENETVTLTPGTATVNACITVTSPQ